MQFYLTSKGYHHPFSAEILQDVCVKKQGWDHPRSADTAEGPVSGLTEG